MPDTATTITVIDACGRAGVSVLLTSPPGAGKSSMVRGLARSRGIPCETVLGSIRDPTDFSGLPVVQDGGVTLWPPQWARNLLAAGAGILLLDELTTCPPAVQAAMLAVALERRVGDLQLPREVFVVACANPPDQAADGWALAPPLANRFCHLLYEPSPGEYLTGLTTGWASPPASRAINASPERRAAGRAAIAGFLKVRPDLIHACPEIAAEASGPWPSRRTWAMTADVLARTRDDDIDARNAITFGLVGDGPGIEYLAWLRQADLPDPEAVLADPSIVDWKGRDDQVWAVLAGVVAHCAAGGGSAERWKAAWGPLVAAAAGGAPDTAAAVSRELARARPAGALPPAAARTFGQFLAQAGLTASSAADPVLEEAAELGA